jgi:hypothetical protein
VVVAASAARKKAILPLVMDTCHSRNRGTMQLNFWKFIYLYHSIFSYKEHEYNMSIFASRSNSIIALILMGFINILRWKWMVQVTFGGHVNVQNNVFWPEGITKYCYSDSISQWRWLTLATDAWTWKLSLLPVYGSRDLKITYRKGYVH